MYKRFTATMLAMSISAALPVSAHAEAAGAAGTGDAAVDAGAPEGLAEIVVTAQRREERLVSVPIAITALSADKLSTSGVTDMGSLAQVVPGLHIDSSGAFFQPSIRGVGTAIAGAGASANVATYVDSVYKPNALSNDFDFIDVDSIQVLKGPQGTLFGRNTTGGAVLVTTKGPSFAGDDLEAKLSYGMFNTASAAVFGSAAFTNQLAASASVGYTRSDGWVKNLVNNTDANPVKDYLARVKVLYAPTDALKIMLTADAEEQNDPSLYAASSYNGFSNAAAFFGVPTSQGDPKRVAIGSPIVHIALGKGLSLKIDGDLGWGSITSITAGHWDSGSEDTDESASPNPPNGTLPVQPCATLATCTYLATGGYNYLEDASWHYTEHTLSQEIDLRNNPGGIVDWQGGLYYFSDVTTYNPFNTALYGPFGPGGALSGALPPWPASSFIDTGPAPTFDFGGLSRSKAVFAEATFNPGKINSTLDNLHITAGGRYDIDTAGVFYGQYAAIATSFAATPRETASTDFHSFVPRVIVRYALTPYSNAYVSWSKGTKAALYNASGFGTQKSPVTPEHLTDIEAGYKISTPNFQLEASIFHYDYKDLQVSSYVGCCAVFQNAPASKIYGGDVHWEQRLVGNFRLDTSVAYTHARYTDFPGAALQQFSPLFGVQTGSAFLVDVSGKPMERTPTWSGTIGPHYDFGLFDGVANLDANYSYTSSTNFDFAGTLVQGGYGLANIRAGWTTPSKKLTYSVGVRNVTNKPYLVQILPNGGGYGATFGEPRSAYVEVFYRH